MNHCNIIKTIARHVKSDRTVFDNLFNVPLNGALLKGITPLCLAAHLGKVSMIKSLLDSDCLIDGCDKNQATPLMYAARNGNVNVVKTLLKHGACYSLKDVNGWSALNYGQQFPQVESLIVAKRSQDFIDSKSKSISVKPISFTNRDQPKEQILIFLAIKNYDVETLQKVLNMFPAADMNYVDSSGLTALQYATRLKPLKLQTEQIVKLLVEKGSDPNIRNERSGKAPLHYIVKVYIFNLGVS